MSSQGLPPKQGLYDPRNEKDSCGIGFVVNVKGMRSHGIIEMGLQVLENMAHRGAVGCDPCTGDGAGVLIQIPHDFMKRACSEFDIRLPGPGRYGLGMVFLPSDSVAQR